MGEFNFLSRFKHRLRNLKWVFFKISKLKFDVRPLNSINNNNNNNNTGLYHITL